MYISTAFFNEDLVLAGILSWLESYPIAPVPGWEDGLVPAGVLSWLESYPIAPVPGGEDGLVPAGVLSWLETTYHHYPTLLLLSLVGKMAWCQHVSCPGSVLMVSSSSRSQIALKYCAVG